jgi:hypothetical protein
VIEDERTKRAVRFSNFHVNARGHRENRYPVESSSSRHALALTKSPVSKPSVNRL